MIIEFAKDTNIRKCKVCGKIIKKGQVLVKYKSIIDNWRNTRMWFAHIDCLINKLEITKDKFNKINLIPKVKVKIGEYNDT